MNSPDEKMPMEEPQVGVEVARHITATILPGERHVFKLGPDAPDQGGETAPVARLRGNVLELCPGWCVYLALPIIQGEAPPDQVTNDGEMGPSTLEFVKATGPVVEFPHGVRGVVVIDKEKGIPFPTFLVDFFPMLRTIRPQGEMAVINPFYHLALDSYPEKLRLTALCLGWDKADIESILEASRPPLESLREWIRRVPLWGYGSDYQTGFLVPMRDRLSTLIDIAQSIGMTFDDGELVGWNIWPKEPEKIDRRAGVSQVFVDFWRLCTELGRWGYTEGSPRDHRPEGMDLLMAGRLEYLVGRLEGIVATLSERPKEPTDCERDILKTLRDVGHRLTTTPLIGVMQDSKRIHGVTTIKQALARLVGEGLLTNRKDVRPRGYGLPEWKEDVSPVH